MCVVAVGAGLIGVVIVVGDVGGGAAGAASYCSAARGVDDYHGHDADRFASLLDGVRRVAPAEIVPVVVKMRHAPRGSRAFGAARATWGRYNTNHCCSCIGGPSVPQVVSTAP